MPSIKIIVRFFIFFQGCFAGLLAGQLFNLTFYEPAAPWLTFGLPAIGAGLGVCLFLIGKQVQKYLLNTFNFQWIYFSSSLVQGLALLLFLLPLLFSFEESPLIIFAVQVISLFFMLFVVCSSYILHLKLLQGVYEDLLQLKRSAAFTNHFMWGASLLLVMLLSVHLFQVGENSLAEILAITLFLGVSIFIPDLLLRVGMYKIFTFLDRYQRWEGDWEKEESISFLQQDPYFPEKNLEKILLKTAAEDRHLIYSRIRQEALVDKVSELERIQEKILVDDEDLAYTLYFLQKIQEGLPTYGVQYEIDSVTHVLDIKGYIRTVIGEGNPMLVQKLLNDSRPEVKKAAILATVYFKEPSFIPALVSLLKEQEFAFAAMEALQKIGDQCLPYLRSAKYRNKENSFLIERCLELVETFRSNEARDFLIEMLNEPQRRFQYKAALALLKNGYSLSSIQKTQILHFIESLIGTIAVIREIYCALGRRTGDPLSEALIAEEMEKEELVIDLLGAFLPKPIHHSVKKILKEESRAGSYSLFVLIDLFFPLLLRSKSKILFGNDRKKNIAPVLQNEYLHEQICFHFKNEKEASRHILKMDYSQIGFWLRVCALKELAQTPGQQVSVQILAEMFNETPLIQEVAAEVLYDLNYDYYFLQMQRLPAERAKVLKYKVENHKHVNRRTNQGEGNLLYDQILFLRSVPLFENSSYEELSRNSRLFTLLSFDGKSKELNFDPYQSVGYWIVYEGEFSITYLGEELLRAGKGDVLNMSFLVETDRHTVRIQPENEIKIFFMEGYSLNKLYLKSRNIRTLVLQPKLNHSSRLQLS